MNKLNFILALLLFLITFLASGQPSVNPEILPDTSHLSNISLGEIEVTSLRVNRRMKEVPMPMSVVGTGNFLKLSAQTLSHVLSAEPGISLGSDGPWATSINIRGFSENRLVILIDGYRVETATDLTASFSMIDVNDIERVEVIKGAQSSLYGSGAMGGIVNIITKSGHFGDRSFVSGNVLGGYASANHMYTVNASVNAGARRWYFRMNGTRNKADDLRTPEGILPNSQFSANNVGLKAGFKPFANHLFTLQYQNNWATDVGIPGGATFPGPAVASYTNISRHLSSATYEITPLQGRLTSLKMNYFTQYIQRDVSMIPNTVTETKLPTGVQRVTPELVIPVGNHLTHGGQLQSQWLTGSKSNLIAGLDLWARKIRTSRTKYIRSEVLNASGAVVKTNKLERGETPIPESMFGSAGLFAEEEIRLLSDRLTLMAGGRIDGICVRNEKGYDIDYLTVNGLRNDTPPNQRITFSEGHRHSLSWSANSGLLFKVTRESDLTLNLARSFRAPSLEERFKYIDLGNFVSLGDPELRPEKGYAADMGWRIWKPGFSLQINGFANRIADLIVETPGEFVYTLNTGASEGTTDTIPAFINANVSNALLYGADFSVQYNVWSGLVIFGSGAFVRGIETETDKDLPRIPPFNSRAGLRYSVPRIGMAELTMVNAASQTHIAEGEKETKGFSRFDLSVQSAQFQFGGVDLQFFAGIDNLTDVSYTNHLSTNRGGISVEPGRNFYIRAKLGF